MRRADDRATARPGIIERPAGLDSSVEGSQGRQTQLAGVQSASVEGRDDRCRDRGSSSRPTRIPCVISKLYRLSCCLNVGTTSILISMRHGTELVGRKALLWLVDFGWMRTCQVFDGEVA